MRPPPPLGGEGPDQPRRGVVTCMQLNFRRSETTWVLCQQELLDRHLAPDVILIQDPPSSALGGRNVFKGYRLVRAPRHGAVLGQVALAIRDTVRFRQLRPFGPRVVLVELATADGPLIFISAYVRHTSGEGLDALAAACRWAKGRCPRVILGLDGNGHSPLWGPPSVRRNQVGSLLEDFIVSCDLDILNDRGGPATFVSDVGDRTWIDLTLSTPCISVSIPDWRVQEDFLSGSDHRPIFFSVDSSPLRTDVFKRRAWDETPWDEFAATVKRACREEGWIEEHTGGTISITCSESIAGRVARLTQILEEAVATHVPEKTICWASKPWWSPAVASARQHMRQMLHRAQRIGTALDWKLYRRARRRFTSMVRKAKAIAWRDFCASINKSDMWQHIPRIMKPRQRLRVDELRMDDGEWAQEDAAKAEVLKRRFFPPSPASQAFQHLTSQRSSEVTEWLANGIGAFPAVTEYEVHRRLMAMRAHAAPGPDGIVARCVQEAAPTLLPILCQLFQRMFEEGTHPAMWRVARVVPVPKPGVDPHLAKGYRPIALLSVLSKVMEGLVKDRLNHILESEHCLNDQQQGFRQGRSTELALWRFVTSATSALKTRKRCVAVALDIERAYDTVDHTALLWKLKSKGIPRYLVAWIRAFLADRKAELVVNDAVFPFDVSVGVPQGSPLSPTLFILFIDDLLEVLEPLVRIQAFADDLLLWIVTAYRGACPPEVQQALRAVETWSQQWGLSFNVSKCQAIDINRMRCIPPLDLQLASDSVPQVREFRYLGIWVDSSLSWARQIDETCTSCIIRLRALRRLCATYWGVHPGVMEVLVRAVIFPRLFYGVAAWGGVARFLNRLRPLDRVLRMSAILTLGLLSTTSTVRAIAACGWLPADLAIRYEIFRFLLRQRTYGREDVLEHDHTLGVNGIISALDTARGEVRRLHRSGVVDDAGWEHLDQLCFREHAPWDPAPALPIRFLPRETALAEIGSLQTTASDGVWIYTDGSILEGERGAAAFFDDARGPFGEVQLMAKLGPLHSITDAELLGMRLALEHLSSRTDWTRAFITSDSQAALGQLRQARWGRSRLTIMAVYRLVRSLQARGHDIRFLWAPGHAGIPGNERADALARAAAASSSLVPETWGVSRTMLEGALRRWFQERAIQQERALAGDILDPLEDTIIRSDLRWLRNMPSRFMAARVGQFLSGHFPTAKYLHRFGHMPTPLCECCGVVDTRGHLLLECRRWTFLRQRLHQWLCTEGAPRSESGLPPPDWTWQFLVQTGVGRIWLGRFLVAIRPRWSMRDQLRSEDVASSVERTQDAGS